uniref:Uncharacterized protein n=1 Tax=Leersia perrieri TaxID=77586 RepID=A0A0D9XNK2_9ORYZ
MFPSDGYTLIEENGALKLGWKDLCLLTASAWRPIQASVREELLFLCVCTAQKKAVLLKKAAVQCTSLPCQCPTYGQSHQVVSIAIGRSTLLVPGGHGEKTTTAAATGRQCNGFGPVEEMWAEKDHPTAIGTQTGTFPENKNYVC